MERPIFVIKSLDEERASKRGLLALVVGVNYLVKLYKDGEREGHYHQRKTTLK